MNRLLKGFIQKIILALTKMGAVIMLCLVASLSLGIGDGASLAAEDRPAIIGQGSYEELGKEYFGYYRIADADDLFWFANEAKTNSDICGLMVADIEINADLTASIIIDPVTGEPSLPLGLRIREWAMIPSFSGVLDGGGHTVSGIYAKADSDNVGMIRIIEEGGAVRNLTVSDSYVYTSANTAGTLAGVNCGEIRDVTVTVGRRLCRRMGRRCSRAKLWNDY